MKKIIPVLIYGVIISQFWGCKKGNDTPPPDTGIVTATIIGQVFDDSGNPLQGAQVTLGGNSKTTNTYGEFSFEKVSVSKSRFYVKAASSGYLPSGAGGIATENSIKYVKIRMISLGVANTLAVTSGGTITANLGAKISFPSMALSYANGGVFTGNAKVYVKCLSPSASNFASLVPGGDLTAQSGGAFSSLYSYGMLGVKLEDDLGSELKVASGSTVEVRLPIAASQLASAPSTIPLLTFDEEKGLWIEEGTATKTGNEYVGNVTHFSWWNCDLIYNPPTTISGRVVDCSGNPLPGITVNFNQYTLVTDNNGNYSGYIPVGIQVSVSVLSSLNNNMFSSSSPVVVNTVSGSNQVQDVSVCPANISGQLKDCNGQATSAYIRIVYSSGYSTLFLSSNGNFTVPVQTSSSFTVKIFNSQSSKDTIVTSGNAGSTLNIGTFTLCSNNGGSCSDGTTAVTDIDGNIYSVVSVGNQCWLLENLKTSRYRNGDPIPTGLSDSLWYSSSAGAYSYYNNDTAYNSQYGKLYNWFAVNDTRNIAPVGWHVATDADWDQLLNYLGGAPVAGGKLKATGTIQNSNGVWESPNTAADNSSGFTALPAGFRNYDGTFSGLGSYSYFFTATSSSSTTAWFYLMNNIAPNTYRNDNEKRIGLSVRCVKD